MILRLPIYIETVFAYGYRGKIEEQTAYLPSGIPYPLFDRTPVTDRRHIGNIWQSFNGYYTYDNTARSHYPLIPSFDTLDPQADKYPSLSPYSHCAGNPRNVVDPSGEEIVMHMTESERANFENMREFLSACGLFLIAYKELEDSKNKYHIYYTNQTLDNDAVGEFRVNKDGASIVLTEGISGQSMAEEFFHAYQYENKDLYKDESFNYEFEAKVLSLFSLLESGNGLGVIKGTEEFSDKIIKGDYGDKTNVTNESYFQKEKILSKEFITDYKAACNKFVKYNIKHNKGGANYQSKSVGDPKSIFKIANKIQP